ncbi:MAG: 3-oxoacyl-ACP synthase III family protein, partial [Vicinamibacteria bacterium]
GVSCSDLGYEASRRALDNAGLRAEQIDFIIFCSLSPDQMFPGSGVFLQDKLGIPGIGALDVRNQCSGFLYGLSVADSFVRIGKYQRILLVGSEVHSHSLDFSTPGRDVTVLFGDGAGAVILGPSEEKERGILSVHLHADGRFAHALELVVWDISRAPFVTHDMLNAGVQWPKMNGRLVFKHAVTRLPEVIREALDTNGVKLADVDHFLFHQANLRINELVASGLGIPQEKVYSHIERFGNMSAATIPFLLDECLEAKAIKKGDLVLMAAFGAGFTWGSALIRW